MAFSETEIEFIDEWSELWRELFDLLFETIRTDKPDTLCRKPSQSDEFRFKNLSSWFIDNEPQFLPLWKKFAKSQNWSLDINENLIQQIHDGEKHLDNPFGPFYSTNSLDGLLHHISDSKNCYPTETQAWSTATALLNLDLLAAEFVVSIYS
jgi:hypothetical protein